MNNKIKIFDTTLRDGEQAAGATMTFDEKMAIAEILDQMKVDVIEAGFAIASDGDFKAVNSIAKQSKYSAICSLARAIPADVERAAEAVKPCEKGRVHTFISTSPIHMQHQLRMNEADVLEATKKSVSLARNLCADVEWSAMDATRSDLDFLCKTIETAINAGAATINIPDTVGYTIPTEFTQLIHYIKNNVPNIDKADISVHCHNDLGLAVANSLAAIEAGAKQIECTINGIGERAGNAALEEIVMAIKTRNDKLKFTTDLDISYIARASKLVANSTGFAVQNNKAIVGANAFAHESGIHQDGVLKERSTYEIIDPAALGFGESSIVMGKHSGRHAFSKKLQDLGFAVTDAQLQAYFKKFKDLADVKKEIFDEDIISLIGSKKTEAEQTYRFESLQVTCGGKKANAKLEITIAGKKQAIEKQGSGPVDAIFKCIKELTNTNYKLDLYQVHSVTGGTDAQAEVTVRLEDKMGKITSGHGANTDTLLASAKAYLGALNKIIYNESLTHQAKNLSI
jgi:2-isopropylmalate synthase